MGESAGMSQGAAATRMSVHVVLDVCTHRSTLSPQHHFQSDKVQTTP